MLKAIPLLSVVIDVHNAALHWLETALVNGNQARSTTKRCYKYNANLATRFQVHVQAHCYALAHYRLSFCSNFFMIKAFPSKGEGLYPTILKLIDKWNKLFCHLRIFCKFMSIFLAKIMIKHGNLNDDKIHNDDG